MNLFMSTTLHINIVEELKKEIKEKIKQIKINNN